MRSAKISPASGQRRARLRLDHIVKLYHAKDITSTTFRQQAKTCRTTRSHPKLSRVRHEQEARS